MPAFSNIVLYGALIASRSAVSPIDLDTIFVEAFSNAIPPPGTIPSLIAAFVAQIASSTLSVFSFSSTYESAPIFTIAILAASIANLFSSFTTSCGCLASAIFFLMSSMMLNISSLDSFT